MAALDRPFDEVIATYERADPNGARRAPRRCTRRAATAGDKGKNAEGMEYRPPRPRSDAAGQRRSSSSPGSMTTAFSTSSPINAYWAGAYRESLDASLKLLASDKLPPSMVKRIAANARFAADKMPRAAPRRRTSAALGAENFVEQHTLVPQRPLHSRVTGSPRVLVAILAKQKEPALPLYLECIEALDYPKSSIVLYIRTNNNTDRTEQILRDWVDAGGPSLCTRSSSTPPTSPTGSSSSASTNGTRRGSRFSAGSAT